jgi:hypothetical protein
MEKPDIEKYILEQAKIEVEHNRSWPTKVLAFYAALNFGIVAALNSLSSFREQTAINTMCKNTIVFTAVCAILITIGAIVIVIYTYKRSYWQLKNNHKNYLAHRKIQVAFQLEWENEFKDRFQLPEDWFKPIVAGENTRAEGWKFYRNLMRLIVGFTIDLCLK